MKNKKLVSLFMISMSLTMLVGCNKEKEEVIAETVVEEEKNMFGLTEDEQKMYAEYAAGVLMKYNAGSNMRVLEGQTLVNLEAKEQAAREQAAKREQLAAEYAANKDSSSKKENQTSGNGSSQETSVSYISDMAVATGNSNFSITYAGYEVTDSYPSSGEDVLLAIDAAPGKVLLVTKYCVTNTGTQTEELDMFSKQAKFKINLNGTSYKAQYTLLLDDLSMYKEDVDAGAAVDTVLVFEIPETVASNMEDMVLSITADNKTSSMQLRGGTVSRPEAAESVDNEEDENVDLSDDEIIDVSEENIDEEDIDEEDIDETESESDEGENVNETESESDEREDVDETEFESDEGGNVTVVGSDKE